mmetsp:Transcript_31903/g.79992  ORF Transcript_31903/g.79992 Transcript_31903/m.79992 type:complete len:223 (+) Transcript_31903:141-809(+)
MATKPQKKNPKIFILLEAACLEPIKYGKEYELLNSDDHIGFMKKHNRNIAEARPDITHQCLLNLLDSPLNKAGYLQIYIHTKQNVLIKVNPSIRLPRTFKRFSGLMVQLLHKLSIRASDGPEKLLQVVKNPFTDHLPPGCRRVGLSMKANKLVDLLDYFPTLSVTPDPDAHESVCFVVGSFAVGKIECDWIEEEIAISKYPLSGAGACAKLCNAIEHTWGIL